MSVTVNALIRTTSLVTNACGVVKPLPLFLAYPSNPHNLARPPIGMGYEGFGCRFVVHLLC